MKYFLTLLILLLITPLSQAARTNPTKIKYIESWVTNSVLYVQTRENTRLNPAGCSYTGQYIVADSAADMVKTMILTAYMQDRSIRLVIYDSSCQNNRPIIVAASFSD